ncbi:MAG: alpha/beta hydrolase [Xanthomonadales bacterium]|nr:alpha/beta hydrolase [Xanthomonadales bacterium]
MNPSQSYRSWPWLLVFFLACACAHSRPEPGSDALPPRSSLLQGLGDTRYLRHESAHLGRDFHIYIRLPEEYIASPDTRFPVLYLLDGGNTYPMLAAFHHYLRLGEETPPAIVVGIAYGSEYYRGGNMRQTDFTAPAADRDFWGGAPDFQHVLEFELLPAVERGFRADPARRILFGHSLGGQFVLFNALTRPELFWGHIASNPALHRNPEFFMKWRGGAGVGSPASNVFVSSGELEDARFREPALKWMESWNEKPDLPWRLEVRTLAGQTHYSSAPEALRQGLEWLYENGQQAQDHQGRP